MQGAAWDSVHLGYFSDPESADVLVETVLETVDRVRPVLIADLGGGTGFILGELARRGLDPRVGLLNLDLSPAQLAAGGRSGIRRLEEATESFQREQLLPGPGTILFIMRSVLHYLGRRGLVPGLRHIRSQMERGEYFIHQTACFDDRRGAACLNAIYAGLRTKKRYPPTAELTKSLLEAGFTVLDQKTCPALELTGEELGRRYGWGRAAIKDLGHRVAERFGRMEGIFRYGPEDFTAWLHYQVFVTRAD